MVRNLNILSPIEKWPPPSPTQTMRVPVSLAHEKRQGVLRGRQIFCYLPFRKKWGRANIIDSFNRPTPPDSFHQKREKDSRTISMTRTIGYLPSDDQTAGEATPVATASDDIPSPIVWAWSDQNARNRTRLKISGGGGCRVLNTPRGFGKGSRDFQG